MLLIYENMFSVGGAFASILCSAPMVNDVDWTVAQFVCFRCCGECILNRGNPERDDCPYETCGGFLALDRPLRTREQRRAL